MHYSFQLFSINQNVLNRNIQLFKLSVCLPNCMSCDKNGPATCDRCNYNFGFIGATNQCGREYVLISLFCMMPFLIGQWFVKEKNQLVFVLRQACYQVFQTFCILNTYRFRTEFNSHPFCALENICKFPSLQIFTCMLYCQNGKPI